MGFGSTFGGPRYVAIAVEQVQEIEERYGVDIKEVSLGTVTAEQMGFSSGGSGGGIGFGFSRKYAIFAFVTKTPGKIIDSDITISRPIPNWFNSDFVLGNSSFFVDNIPLGTTNPSANYALSEALTTSNNLNFGYGDNFSCSFWLKASPTNNNNGLVGTWAGRSVDVSNAKGFLFYVHTGSYGKPRFIFGTDAAIGGHFGVTVNSQLDDAVWRHVCFTWEGTTNTITSSNINTYLKVYYNGTLQSLTGFSTSGTLTSPNFATDDLKLQIGTWRWTSNYPNPANSVDARRFDEMGFWDKTLSPSEVTALYNSGNGALCDTVASSNLITRYSFDIESTHNSYRILDKVGNNHLEIVLP